MAIIGATGAVGREIVRWATRPNTDGQYPLNEITLIIR